MTTYKAKNQKRDYETTNIFFLKTIKTPDARFWEVCEESEINYPLIFVDEYNDKNGIWVTEEERFGIL